MIRSDEIEANPLIEAALAVLDCFDSGLFKNYHDDECPEDDTCECEGTMILRQLQAAAIGKDRVAALVDVAAARERAAAKGRAL